LYYQCLFVFNIKHDDIYILAEQDVFDYIVKYEFKHDEYSSEYKRLKNRPDGDQRKGLKGVDLSLPTIEQTLYHLTGYWIKPSEIKQVIENAKPHRLDPTAASFKGIMEMLSDQLTKNKKKRILAYIFSSSHGYI
jgi:hypothetical protein